MLPLITIVFFFNITQERCIQCIQIKLHEFLQYLPTHVTKEFDEYLKCGRLEHEFLRVRCESSHDEKLVAFSCKRRGFCPSCGAWRMTDSAALLVDEILPYQPMRQWVFGNCSRHGSTSHIHVVVSVPFPLRFLFASKPKVMTRVLSIVYFTPIAIFEGKCTDER